MRKISPKQRLKIECVTIVTKQKLEEYPRCTFCPEPAITCHHWIHQSRSNYLRCDKRNLIPICGKCHYRLHNGYESIMTAQLIKMNGQQWADELVKDQLKPIKDTMGFWKQKRELLKNLIK